ncbi:efflux RND transporter periplasmic adaptor subunit [Desertibaculum subflavum]|uniref:efflux RND transporter periplasmic adaptor subunit n=1 Tax=Desertibaculum subflavum TaxID=2268458 RepID=UPI000E66591E
MRRLVVVLLIALVLGAGAFGAWRWWAAPGEAVTALPTQTVVMGDVENSVSALGTLQPQNYVDVGTQVSGQLQTIKVEIGDKVEQGQLLAEIDPTVYQSRVNADEAQLLGLQAQMLEKQAQRRLLENQLKRQKELLAARATSEDAYEIAAAALQQVTAQIQALEAQAKQTQSTLNGDLANLRYTKIYAPLTGTVVSITARRGQTLNANQTAPIILRIADLDTMTVWTQVSEADVPKLKLGMPAHFTTLGQPGKRWSGKLRQILPTPDVVNNVVLYNALFDVANPGHELLPQMSAQVFFILGEARGVPVVPMAALKPQRGSRGQRFTARVMQEGVPVERQVEVGVTSRLVAEVKSGLAAGDEVVLEPGGERPAPGQRPRMPRL